MSTSALWYFLPSDPNSDLEAATKHYVDQFSGVGKYLPLSGGVINPGPLRIENQIDSPRLTMTGLSGIGAYSPELIFNIQATGAATGIIQGQRNGALRWAITPGDGFQPENGSGVGTDFIISRYQRRRRAARQRRDDRAQVPGAVQIAGTLNMLGAVTLPGDPQGNLEAATKRYVDSSITAVQGAYLPLSGGQLSGGLSFGQRLAPNQNPIDMSQHISLFDGWGGFTITSGNLNIVAGGQLAMNFDGPSVFMATGVGLYLSKDPTGATEAVPLRYLQANYVPVVGGGYVAKTGDTMTGSLAITNATSASLSLTGTGTAWPAVLFDSEQDNTVLALLRTHRYGLKRWAMYIGNTDPETGGNFGTNFLINRFDDSGNLLSPAAFSITRQDGYVTVGNTISVGRDPITSLEVVTLQYLQNNSVTAAAGDARWVNVTGDTMTGTLTLSAPGTALRVTTNAVFTGSVGTGALTANSTLFVASTTTLVGAVTAASAVSLNTDPTTARHAVPLTYLQTNYLSLGGGTMQGGIVFADVWGQGPSDATHHLILHSGFGIGVSQPDRMNYIGDAASQHVFICGGDVAWIQAQGLFMASGSDIILSRVPTNSFGAVPKSYADLMLPLAGGVMTGGLVFNNSNYNLVSGRPDTSHHITLFSGYGFSITGGSLNIVTGQATWFSNSATGLDFAYFDDYGLHTVGARTVNVGRDPTAPMDVVTLQYFNAQIVGTFLPISGGIDAGRSEDRKRRQFPDAGHQRGRRIPSDHRRRQSHGDAGHRRERRRARAVGYLDAERHRSGPILCRPSDGCGRASLSRPSILPPPTKPRTSTMSMAF